jgi:hypothetical protein
MFSTWVLESPEPPLWPTLAGVAVAAVGLWWFIRQFNRYTDARRYEREPPFVL